MVSMYSCIVGNRFEYQSSSPDLQVPIIKECPVLTSPFLLRPIELTFAVQWLLCLFLDVGSLVFVKINEPPLMGLWSLHIRQW
jgi:hypothetical protein